MIRWLAVVVAALALASPAVAGDIGVTFGIATGTLGAKAAPTSLGGTVQVPITVVDARGNGAGWTLRLGGAGAPSVTRLAVRCAAGSTCTLPAASASLPSKLGSATPVLSAAPKSGMGAIVVVATVRGGHGTLRASVASS